MNEEEFRIFKELLRQGPVNRNIKLALYTEVSMISRQGLLHLLDKHYTKREAWEIALNVFLQMNRRDLWEKAQEERTRMINSYKINMKKKFHLIWEKETCLYVPEYFYRETIQVEYEELENVYHSEEASRRSLTVVVQGSEGIGKTTLLRKAMLEWAHGNFWKDRFTFVFFLNAHDMNRVAETSLVDFLFVDWPEGLEVYDYVFAQPRNILFIVDGFEKLRFELKLDDNTCDDWCQQRPMEIILSSLLQKKMLPDSSLLVALAPVHLEKILLFLKHPKYIFLQGFSERQRENYFSQFFRENARTMKAFSFVKGNGPLLALCQSPLICWLVCSCLKWQLDRGADLEIACLTFSSLYLSSFISVVKAVGENSPPEQNVARLKGLCSLAAEGIWTRTCLFHQEDLRKNGIFESDLAVWLGTNFLLSNGDHVTFIHHQIQEFCAAMFYLLKQPQENPSPVIGTVTQLMASGLQGNESCLCPMGRFVFGLATENITKMLETSLNFQLSQEIRQEIIQHLKCLTLHRPEKADLNFQELLKGLFETQEDELIRQVMDLFEDISLHISNGRDLVIASYCLRQCQNLQTLSLNVAHTFSDDVEPASRNKLKFWKSLFSVFNTSQNLKVLALSSFLLGEDYLKAVYDVMAQPICKLQSLAFCLLSNLGDGVDFFKAVGRNSHLKYLNLYGTYLSDTAMQELCKILKNPATNIEQLTLSKCGITKEACKGIASVLICNNKLKHISFLNNPLRDKGVRILCGALKHRKCALEMLVLNHCCLSSVSCDHISQVLLCSQSLTCLDLGSNSLGDKAMISLCEALKNPNCRLQELWMTHCFLTAKCCEDISSVLISNPSLKTLKLGTNDILDVGVKQLCEALKHPNCALETLGLDMCALTTDCCEDLASALITCRSLKVLNLDSITLDYDGAMMLCEALRHPNCVLQTLGIQKAKLDEECQSLLKTVEHQISNLTEFWIGDEFSISGVGFRERRSWCERL